MTKCMVCGGSYKDMLVIRYLGQEQAFDCFQCAIHALAPHCALCGVPVIGHGVDEGGRVYCCRHCADQAVEGALEAARRDRRPQAHQEGSHDRAVPVRKPSEPRTRD
jgi:hypothetical protein